MNVQLIAKLTPSPVPTGLIVAAMVASITVAGAAEPVTQTVEAVAFGTDNTSTPIATFNFTSLPLGDFTGSIQAVTSDGTPVGSALSFSNPGNSQLTPSSVSVSVS